MLSKEHRKGRMGIYNPILLFQDSISPLVDSFDVDLCIHNKTWKLAEQVANKDLDLPNLSLMNLKCSDLHAIDFLLGEKNILAVEDNSVSMKLLLKTISDLSTDILKAKNGEEAMELIESEGNIGLVLLDMQMPIMDGSEFIEEVIKCFGDLPFAVILVSELTNWEESKRLIEKGVLSSVKKPFKKEDFYHTVLSSLISFNNGLPIK